MSLVIARFAPSPTGFLHIGGIRTALVNYLLVQKFKKENSNSKLFLRIEDTDKERSDEKYFKSIIEGLDWLNIKWDGAIIKQSNNINFHKKIAEKLLKNKGAYKCICTQEELSQRRKINLERKKSIKRLCTDCEMNEKIQSASNNYCIRIKVNEKGYTEIEDLVQGNIKISNKEIDNFVLTRNDGSPTYMLSVVADDYNMGITHIIRGDDHLNNAFRQYHLYKNLNWHIPKFAHIPLIHGRDGKKLSKRHGSTDINEFKNLGYLPDAIINYLLKLGICSIEDEIFTTSLAIEKFKLNSVLKSPSKFDYEKLNFINSHYLSNLKNDNIINKLKKYYNLKFEKNREGKVNNIINTFKKRTKTLLELNNIILDYIDPNINILNVNIALEEKKIIKIFYEEIKNANKWTSEDIGFIIEEFTKKNKIKLVKLGQPLRQILTGKSKGPSIIDILYILGKENTLKRINDFLI